MHHYFWNNSVIKKCICLFLITDEPEFTTHPDSQTVTKGSPVNFSSDAHGVPEPNFSWFKNGAALAESSRISFLGDKKKLRITGVEMEDSGEYQCVASNEVNNRVTSDPAKLTVEGKNTFAHLILEPST